MLTRKQYELLIYIDRHLKSYGVSPSFDEMKDALHLKSKSGIHRLITALEERGFIRRLPHRARALEIVRMPENAPDGMELPPLGKQPLNLKVIEGDFNPPAAFPGPAAEAGATELPFYGRIAAGTPIEALRDETAMIDVPAGMLGSGNYYALEVDGESMIDAGILDGDTVIIERSETAENGSIVVALVDDAEVTLKRLRRRGDSIALEPANAQHEIRIFGPDRVKVQGQLVGLMRQY